MAGNLDKNYNIYDIGLDKNLMRNDLSVLPNLNKSDQSDNNFYGDKFMGGLFDPLDGTYDPQSIRSGELPSLIGHGKKNFTDTVAGLLMGVDTDKIYKWIIGDATSSADWSVTTIGTFTIKGSITATTGTIGGFSIGADYIRDVGNKFGLSSTVTAGDDVRFWVGDTYANRAIAPFNLTEAGILTMGTSGGRRFVFDGTTNLIKFFNSSNVEVARLGNSGSPSIILDIDSPSSSLVYPIQIIQRGASSQASIFIQNEDFGAGSIGMHILQKGDKSALYLRNDTTSTGNVLDIEHSRTSGGITEVVKIHNYTTGSYTLNIIDDNSTSSTVYLNKKTASGAGIYIDSTNLNTTGFGLYSNMQGQGYAIFAYSSNANTTQSTVFLGSSGKNVVLDIGSNSTLSDLPSVQIYQSSNYYGVAFKKIFSLNTTVIWRSNGTNPNGVLSGTVGDICVNGDSNKPAYCTGGTNWTNLV